MNILERSYNVIETAPSAILTTINSDGYPESRAMLNLRNLSLFPSLAEKTKKLDDGTTLLFSTNTSSSKIKQLIDDKRVSIYYCLSEQFRGVWVSGNMEIVENPEMRDFIWQTGWEMYYPKGVQDPDHTVLRLVPVRIRSYENISVEEWRRE